MWESLSVVLVNYTIWSDLKFVFYWTAKAALILVAERSEAEQGLVIVT